MRARIMLLDALDRLRRAPQLTRRKLEQAIATHLADAAARHLC